MAPSAFRKLPESSKPGQGLNFDKMYIQYPETSPPDAQPPLHSIPCPNGGKKKKSTKGLGPRGDALVGIIFLVVEFQQFRTSSNASPHGFNDVCCQRREPQERTGL